MWLGKNCRRFTLVIPFHNWKNIWQVIFISDYGHLYWNRTIKIIMFVLSSLHACFPGRGCRNNCNLFALYLIQSEDVRIQEAITEFWEFKYWLGALLGSCPIPHVIKFMQHLVRPRDDPAYRVFHENIDQMIDKIYFTHCDRPTHGQDL